MLINNLLFYKPADKAVKISVYFQNGTFWLTLQAMAELFGVKVLAVSKHLKNIFGSGELNAESTISISETVHWKDKTGAGKN